MGSFLPEPEILQLRHIGFSNRVFHVLFVYNVGLPYIRKSVIVRITGDWDGWIEEPQSTPSPDLNQDGKVDIKDLLLFQGSWGR